MLKPIFFYYRSRLPPKKLWSLKRFTEDYRNENELNLEFVAKNSTQDFFQKFFNEIRRRFKTAQSSSPFDTFKKEFSLTNEFDNSFYIFESALGTNLLIRQINVFSFKKYLSLFIYFMVLEIWIFSPIILTVYVYDSVSEQASKSILIILGNLGWLFLMYIVMGLSWRTNLKVFLKEINFLALKKAINEFYVFFNLNLEMQISNPIALHSEKDFLVNFDVIDNDTKINKDRDTIINSLQNILNNKDIVYKKANRIQNFLSRFHFFNFLFQALYFGFFIVWMIIDIQTNFHKNDINFVLLIYSCVFVGLCISYIAVVGLILISIKSFNSEIYKINTLFNQKLLNFYLTSHYQIPSIYIIFKDKGKKEVYAIESGLGDYNHYISVNFCNAEHKRCTDEFNENSFNIFIEEIKNYKDLCEKGDCNFFGSDTYFIYNKKLNILNRLLSNKNEYIE